MLEHMKLGMDRSIAHRRAHGSGRFLDVQHEEFNNDPSATVRRIYDWLGVELKAGAAAEMAAWSVANRRGNRGEHSYDLEFFGLDRNEILEKFTKYINYFGINVN